MRLIVAALVLIMLLTGVLTGVTLLREHNTSSVHVSASQLETVESTVTSIIDDLYLTVTKLNFTLTYVRSVLLPRLEKEISIRDVEHAEALLSNVSAYVKSCVRALSSLNRTYLKERGKLPPGLRLVLDRYIKHLMYSFMRDTVVLTRDTAHIKDVLASLRERVIPTVLTAKASPAAAHPGQYVHVYGTLRDKYGHPLPNQKITLYLYHIHLYTLTNSSGRYSFTLRLPTNITSREVTLTVIYDPPRDSRYGGSLTTVIVHVLPLPVRIKLEKISGMLCPGGWVSFRLRLIPNVSTLASYGTLRLSLGNITYNSTVSGNSIVSINLTIPHIMTIPDKALIVFIPSVPVLSEARAEVNLEPLYRPPLKSGAKVSFSSMLLYPLSSTLKVRIWLSDQATYTIGIVYDGLSRTYEYSGPLQVTLSLPLGINLLAPYVTKRVEVRIVEHKICALPVTYSLQVSIINIVPVMLAALLLIVMLALFHTRKRVRTQVETKFELSEEAIPTVLERAARVVGARVSRGCTIRELAQAVASKLQELRGLLYSTVYVYERVRFGLKRSENDILRALATMLISHLRSLLRRS